LDLYLLLVAAVEEHMVLLMEILEDLVVVDQNLLELEVQEMLVGILLQKEILAEMDIQILLHLEVAEVVVLEVLEAQLHLLVVDREDLVLQSQSHMVLQIHNFMLVVGAVDLMQFQDLQEVLVEGVMVVHLLQELQELILLVEVEGVLEHLTLHLGLTIMVVLVVPEL
jgi:hypothetical protein